MTLTRPLGYRADIDGLRAIAVGLVVIFHFGLLPIGGVGFMGVDVFFVISGFLITRVILQGLDTGKFAIWGFYLARVRRLYPAFLAVIVLYLAVGWFFLLPGPFRELSIEALLSQVYVINFYFWKEVNYFGLQAKDVPLLHMWSLSVEEQFYIVYPLLLVFLSRLRPGLLLASLIGLVLGSFAIGFIATYKTPGAAFYLLPARAWELGVGAVLVVALRQYTFPIFLKHIAGPLGLALIGIALTIHTPLMAFPGWFALFPVGGAAALILAGSYDTPGLVSRGLATAQMVWIGRLSYPLYLVHWPVLVVMKETLPELTWGWRVCGLTLSVLLSWAILRYVETPIRSGRWFATTRSFLRSLGLTIAGLVTVCVLGFVTDGLPNRFAPQVLNYLNYAKADPAGPDLMACRWPGRDACALGPEGPASVAIIGDSHAWALAGAADLWLDQIQRPGRLSFGSGCVPVLGAGIPRCRDFMQHTMNGLVASPTIETVLLVSIWRQYDVSSGMALNGVYLKGPDLEKAFTQAFLTTVETLQNAGKSVVIIDPLYAAPYPVPETLARNLAYGNDWPVDTALSDHRADFAKLEPVLAKAAASGAYRVSLIDDLCSSGICSGLLEGTPVFADTNHLRFAQSPYFADILAHTVPKAALP